MFVSSRERRAALPLLTQGACLAQNTARNNTRVQVKRGSVKETQVQITAEAHRHYCRRANSLQEGKRGPCVECACACVYAAACPRYLGGRSMGEYGCLTLLPRGPLAVPFHGVGPAA